MENTSSKPKKQGGLFSKFAFAMGNMGHAAFYAALSNYFIIFVTSGLFVGLPKNIANKLIVLITTLIVVIRVVEIMIDPVLGNIVGSCQGRSSVPCFWSYCLREFSDWQRKIGSCLPFYL